MGILVLKVYRESAVPETYGENYFNDIANIVGNDSGQMTNTLVSENMQYLNNYSFSSGNRGNDGKSAIYTTLNHEANRAVYDSFGSKNGAAIAYNYKTGEILICVSRPGLNPFNEYTDL